MELIELLKFLCIDESLADKSIDELKTPFAEKYAEKKYIQDDPKIVDSIIGKRMNIITQNIAKRLGVSHDTLKSKKVEDILEEVFNDHEKTTTELKQAAEKGLDDRYKQLNDDFVLTKKERDDYKKLADENKQLAEREKKSAEETINGYARKNILSKTLSSFRDKKSDVQFVDTFGENEEKYLNFLLNESVDLHLDEKKENLIPKTKDGNLIPLPGKADMAGLNDIVTQIADKQGWIKKNGQKDEGKKKPERQGGGDDKPEKLRPGQIRRTSLIGGKKE